MGPIPPRFRDDDDRRFRSTTMATCREREETRSAATTTTTTSDDVDGRRTKEGLGRGRDRRYRRTVAVDPIDDGEVEVEAGAVG